MCQHLTVLSYITPHRLVAQCEHGTVHINWDIAVLNLKAADFVTLARFLACHGLYGGAPTVTDGWCHLARDRHGSARLWVGQAGLSFSADDLMSFVSLVVQVAAKLEAPNKRATNALHATLFCPELTVDAGSFVLN